MKKVFICLAAFIFSQSIIFAEKITFSANSMSGQADSSANSTILKGSAFVKTETMEIAADSIELKGENYRTIVAEGNVSGKNLESKMEFTCDSLEYDRETKIAVIKGNVKLTDIENDVKADAQIIEYNQNSEVALLQIQVRLTQKNNICTGAYALYQKKNQLLELSGNAQVKQDKDTFRAQQISLNLDTQEITLEGNVKGAVTTENKKNAEVSEENPEETAAAQTEVINTTENSQTELEEKSIEEGGNDGE